MKTNRTTHVQFLQVADWLRSKRDSILKERPTRPALGSLIKKDLGFEPSEKTIGDILKSTGIAYTARQLLRASNASVSKSARAAVIENIRVAVVHLYHKLGEPVPAPLHQTENDLKLLASVSLMKTQEANN